MTAAPSPSLNEWSDAQMRVSAAKMAEAVSATALVKHRPGFGQTVRPAKGSVVAAVGSAESEDEPDYFFHWLRDSAVIMDAALILIRNGVDADGWKQRFADFVRFSLGLSQISGRRFLAEVDFRSQTRPELRQYLRSEEDIAGVEGDRVLGEVRYNADGTLDFLRWGRPQHDGPAARALVVLCAFEAGASYDALADSAADLLRLDLDYTLKHGGAPCYDIWEEEEAQHYYTCLLQCAALHAGSSWAAAKGTREYASRLSVGADQLRDKLEDFWAPENGFLVSRLMPPGRESLKALDFSVILGLLHARMETGPHSIADDRAAMTMDKLEALFAADYAINRSAGPGLAFGRYRGDSYVSGGAWFICTFGAAEFYYRRADAFSSERSAAQGPAELIAKGDAILETARRFIPETGEISEQFDKTTGEQTSAKNLIWSNAAFISVWQARKNALARNRQ